MHFPLQKKFTQKNITSANLFQVKKNPADVYSYITPTVKIPTNFERVQSDMKFSKEKFGFFVAGVIVQKNDKFVAN